MRSRGSSSRRAPMHIELTEMLRCPEAHELDVLVLSTGEMVGRMVRSGVVGCPVCKHEYPIVRGVVDFTGGGMRDAGGGPASTPPASRISHPDAAQALQALLDLSGPGGMVARALVLGADAAVPPWLEEGHRVLLRGRRFVVEREDVVPPPGIRKLAVGQGLWAGEKS